MERGGRGSKGGVKAGSIVRGIMDCTNDTGFCEAYAKWSICMGNLKRAGEEKRDVVENLVKELRLCT